MRLPLLTAASALCSVVAGLPAQTGPCFTLNDQNTNVSMAVTVFGFAGPNTWGYRFTPVPTVVARGVRILTGNTSTAGSFMTAEIWTEDPTTNLPGSRIAGGTWAISGSLGTDWQGTNLDGIAILNAQTPYWLVWTEPGFSQVPTEPGGVTGPVARLSGGTWSPLQPDAIKLRIFCVPLDALNIAVNGQPCPGGSGSIGTLFTNQPPMVGNADFAVEGTGFPSGAPAFFVFGVDPTFRSVSLPGFATGCMQHTDVIGVIGGTTGSGGVRSMAAAGHVALPLGIPATPSLAGAFVGSQLGVFDAGSPAAIPFMVSNGLQITVF